jgi:hypothetical protein
LVYESSAVLGHPAWWECIVLDIPERAVFYRVLFHYFERFSPEYEGRFEKAYGFFRPIIKEVAEGHQEAWKAVVISKYLAKGTRSPRRFAPPNDASTAATRATDSPGSGVRTVAD